MEISSDMDECFRKVESSLALFQWRRRRYRVPLPQGCFIVSSHGADRPMSFGMQRAIRTIRQSLCLVKDMRPTLLPRFLNRHVLVNMASHRYLQEERPMPSRR